MLFPYPHPPSPPLSSHRGSLNGGAEASVDVPSWAARRGTPTRSRLNAVLLQMVRGSLRTSSFVLRGSLSRGNGRSPRAAPAAPHPSPLSPGSSVGCRPGPRPPPPALSPGSSCARSGPGSAPAPQWPCSPITLMSAPLPLGFIGSQPAPPG